ncbi:MAG TPA: HisA/HisF-related TIM barrel protein [Candidatus Sulfotelmatobacter sp.]|jgi:phosphoribosylformimino-5-aminoimidazole carboxamide ribotide isomerase
MLIPSIDLMGGKIVQLVQGKRKALEFDDFDTWVQRFSKYPLVQLIDLDAAIGTGNNVELVREMARRLPCQVGGGIRSVAAAESALAAGARRVIIGSALFAQYELNKDFAEGLAGAVGARRLVFALDAIGGRVATHGWRKVTNVSPLQMVQALESWCDAFLYTNVETEGLLQGFPQEVIRPLRDATARQLIAAGGIRSQKEIDDLQAIGVDAVVGMAIYKGLLPGFVTSGK